MIMIEQEARAANTTQYNLKIANKIFFSTEEPVRDCVLEILDTEIERLNFVNESDASRDQINSWVETNTNGKIRDIIPSGFITPQTRLAIVSNFYHLNGIVYVQRPTEIYTIVFK